MRFWDASAILPHIIGEVESRRVEAILAEDHDMAVWYWTSVECVSALERKRREGLSEDALATAEGRLLDMRGRWKEIGELGAVRQRAERCIRLHVLRAADAGQLAAALVLSEQLGVNLPFVTFDPRLAAAARREGLSVLGAVVK